MTQFFTTYLAIALTLLLPLPAKADGKSAAHERVIPLQDVENFRDLGGYRTSDGRTVKWGMLYRSGALNDLTPDGFSTLERLGIRTVTDFRSTEERQHAPVNWPGASKPTVYATDYAAERTSLGDLMRGGNPTAEETRKAFEGVYAELPYQFAGQYRRMFAELVAGHAPLIFNCTAGKDRTGVAAALLLSALGVPRATVIEDFLLSAKYYHGSNLVAAGAHTSSPWSKVSPDVIKIIRGVEPRYLEAAFASIDRRSGSLDGYFRKELGLTPEQLLLLRTRYLE